MSELDLYFKLRPPEATPPEELCACRRAYPIKLMCALGYNPIHCVECNREVAPATLALTSEQVEAICSWRDVYDGLDHLWLDSGEYELWAREQLADINSAVNRRGLVLRQALEGIRRCYYWYFQDDSAEDFVPISVCPQCHRGLEPHGWQLVCEHCSIITSSGGI